jgi:hypothetical protein
MRFRLRWYQSTWYRVGFGLVFISVLWWLIIGLAMAARPEYIQYIVEFGFLISAAPLAFGIYCLRRSRRMSRKTKPWRVRVDSLGTGVREKLHQALRDAGLEANLAKRGRAEEKTGESSLGLIEITGQPINWVNVNSRTSEEGETSYYLNFGLTDWRLRPQTPDIVIRSVRRKRFLIFGSVTDIFWKGREAPVEIIGMLNGDLAIKELLLQDGNLSIRAHGRYHCWTITPDVSDVAVPSPALWHCYRRIAHHLLASALIFEP